MNKRNKGFTLLEILLVIAAIGILASIVIVAINPLRQISKAENAGRWGGINTLQKALDQYYIDNNGYPSTVVTEATGEYGEVCDTRDLADGEGTPDCTDKIDLRYLVPKYLGAIPKDPKGEGYKVGINTVNGKISVWADQAALGELIIINPIELALVINGTNEVGETLTVTLPTGITVDPNNIVWYTVNGGIETEVATGASYTVQPGDVGNNIVAKVIIGGQILGVEDGGGVGAVSLSITGTTEVGSTLSAVVGGMTVNPNDIIWYTVVLGLETQVGTGVSYIVQSGDEGKEIVAKVIIGGQTLAIASGGNISVPIVFSSGNIDTSFNVGTGFNNIVWTTESQSDGKVIVGGDFTSYQGVAGNNRLVRLNSNGSRDNSGFQPGTGFNNWVYEIAIQSDEKVLVGGSFSIFNGITTNGIVRLDSAGIRDNSFDIGTGFNGVVNTIKLQTDEKVIVGGGFTTYQGLSSVATRIVRLNSNGSIDSSFNIGSGFNNLVNITAIQSDGKVLVGGNFTTYRDVVANRIIRLNSDGTRDNSFDIGTGFNGVINTIELQSGGKVLVGGNFTTYQGVSANRIIRLNSDGTRDNSFDIGTGFNGVINTIELQSDGKVLVGGNFTTYRGVSMNRIIRINSDGTRDTSFNVGAGVSIGVINIIELQSDGKVLVGGSFTSYNGVSVSRIIRLE